MPRPPQAKQIELDSGASAGNGGLFVFPRSRSRRWTDSARRNSTCQNESGKTGTHRVRFVFFYHSDVVCKISGVNMNPTLLNLTIFFLNQPFLQAYQHLTVYEPLVSSVHQTNKKLCPNRTFGDLSGSKIICSRILE